MERKGQGALEYLLLIGGAILVAVIVISILVGLGGSGGVEAGRAAADAGCAKYVIADCPTTAPTATTGMRGGYCNYACQWNASSSRCKINYTGAVAVTGAPSGTTC